MKVMVDIFSTRWISVWITTCSSAEGVAALGVAQAQQQCRQAGGGAIDEMPCLCLSLRSFSVEARAMLQPFLAACQRCLW